MIPGLDAELRRAASYPSPTPSGWYHLADSEDLRSGDAETVVALGERWRVFRAWSGEIGVTHEASGASAAVRERYGMVLAWPGAEPAFEPDLWPEVEAPDVVARGRHATRDIRMHLLEFAENSVDRQHFARLHGDLRLPWTRWRVPGVAIHHVAGWEIDPERPFVVRFTDDAVLAPLGRALLRTGARAEATLAGPGSLVMFRISIPDLGDTWIAQTNTPVTGAGEPLRLRVRFRWWSTAWRVPGPLAWYVVGNWVSQWWEDVDVWERKHHVRRPVLAKVDGPVHRLRHWFAQFYDDDEARRWLGARARPLEARA